MNAPISAIRILFLVSLLLGGVVYVALLSQEVEAGFLCKASFGTFGCKKKKNPCDEKQTFCYDAEGKSDPDGPLGAGHVSICADKKEKFCTQACGAPDANCYETIPGLRGSCKPGQVCSSGCECITVDGDLDGYSVLVDCDDTNSQVNPGMTEACNNVDDDCSDGKGGQDMDLTTGIDDHGACQKSFHVCKTSVFDQAAKECDVGFCSTRSANDSSSCTYIAQNTDQGDQEFFVYVCDEFEEDGDYGCYKFVEGGFRVCGEEVPCGFTCVPDACDIRTNRVCNAQGQWELRADYCQKCGTVDSDCASTCLPGACDANANRWCNNGAWDEEDYCEECGGFDSDCPGSCFNNQCDTERKLYCEGGLPPPASLAPPPSEADYNFVFIPTGAWSSYEAFVSRGSLQYNVFIDVSPLEACIEKARAVFVPLEFVRSRCPSLTIEPPLPPGEEYSALVPSEFLLESRSCALEYVNQQGLEENALFLASFEERGGGAAGQIEDTIWVGLNSLGDVVAHELGHVFLLCDEYDVEVYQAQDAEMREIYGISCPNQLPADCPGNCVGDESIQPCCGSTPTFRDYSGAYGDLEGFCEGEPHRSLMAASLNSCGYDRTGGYEFLEEFLTCD